MLPNQRIPINVDGNEDVFTLADQIAEKLSLKLDFLHGITDLIIKNIMKIYSGKNKFDQEKEIFEPLPVDGPIKDAIDEDDVLICDFESREIWVKAIIILNSPDMVIRANASVDDMPTR